MAKKVDELPSYRKASQFAVSVTAILQRPAVRRDRKLREQITDAPDSIQANIEEGFEQGTDRAFAKCLTTATGSVGEVIGHLNRAHRKGYLSAQELETLVPDAEELGRMLGGFIKYLHACDWKDRGRHGFGAGKG